MRILVCRSDNLGDLLLSLPAIKSLRQSFPEADIGLLAKKNNLKLLKTFLEGLRIRPISLEETWDGETWDAFVALFCTGAIAARVFLKKVPVRVGQYSKIWSFLLFNQGRRQKRSLAEQSEGNYSYELVQELILRMGGKPVDEIPKVELPEEGDQSELASEALAQIGIHSDSQFVVIHPGMAGSALNLSPEQYAEIIRKMNAKTECLISVGPSKQDQIIWSHLKSELPNLKKISGLELGALKEVFRKSRMVIAPSTGPLHLAHLVGVPVVGLYSPIRAHHARRWKPWGGDQKSVVHWPQVDCPAKSSCWGSSCPKFNCMEKIDWASLILKEVDGLT